MADTAWDAYNGLDKFKDKKVGLRTLAVFYPNRMQVVTIEGKGIDKFSDLKGKRVSTGAPASGTEVMALRLIEAYGLDPNKDMTRERLSVAESVNALKDRKIDAFFWVGGVPTPSVTDLAATPGLKMKLIDHGDGAENMRKKFGPIYVKNRILANAYPARRARPPTWTSGTCWWCRRTPTRSWSTRSPRRSSRRRKTGEGAQGRGFLDLANQMTGASPIPFHPGSLRYFKEKGLKVN
jgi:TRAP transporter TAXI family solute receptor